LLSYVEALKLVIQQGSLEKRTGDHEFEDDEKPVEKKKGTSQSTLVWYSRNQVYANVGIVVVPISKGAFNARKSMWEAGGGGGVAEESNGDSESSSRSDEKPSLKSETALEEPAEARRAPFTKKQQNTENAPSSKQLRQSIWSSF